MTGVGGHF